MGRWQSVDGEGLEETLCLVGLVIGEDGEELLEPLESEVVWRELSGSGDAVEGGGGLEEVVSEVVVVEVEELLGGLASHRRSR